MEELMMIAFYTATVLKGSVRKVYKMCKQAKDMKQAQAWRRMIHASIVASSEGYPTIAMVEKPEEKYKDDNNQTKQLMANNIMKGIDN